MSKKLTGKDLNEWWGVGAKHALYREDGKWYHQLTNFPGALFDGNGYILFETEQDYRECAYLQIKKDLHIVEGISSIPGYVRISKEYQLQTFSHKIKETAGQDQIYVTQNQKQKGDQILETPKALDLPDGPDEVERALVQLYRIIRDTAIARRVKYIHNYRCQVCGDTIKLDTGVFYAEAHHIRPLGGKHKGPDVIENIMCVCPNHHVLLDYGAIKMDKTTLRLAEGHLISAEYIDYHNDIICGNNKFSIS